VKLNSPAGRSRGKPRGFGAGAAGLGSQGRRMAHSSVMPGTLDGNTLMSVDINRSAVAGWSAGVCGGTAALAAVIAVVASPA